MGGVGPGTVLHHVYCAFAYCVFACAAVASASSPHSDELLTAYEPGPAVWKGENKSLKYEHLLINVY